MIPKIIHFIWMQGYEELPPDRRYFIDGWAHKHSDWEIRVWSQDELPELQNSWVLDTDDPTLQSDVLRFELVYQYGGVYLDADMECLKSLNSLTMFVGTGDAFISKRTRDMLASSSFGASPQHPWIADVLREIGRMKSSMLAGAGQIRGPIERATRHHPEVVRFHRSFMESACCESNAVATHYKLGSWRDEFRAALKQPRSSVKRATGNKWRRQQAT